MATVSQTLTSPPPLWWRVLNSGWFGVTAGFVLFLIATAIAVWLYHRGKRRPKLSATVVDTVVIAPTDDGVSARLQILFDNRNVDRVTATTIGIWNDGTETFHGRDIVRADALRVELLGSGEILQASIEAMSRPFLGVRTEIFAMDTAHVEFDFLDPSDGFRISVIHSGRPGYVALLGNLRGLPTGLSIAPKGTRLPWFGWLMLVGVAIQVLGGIGMAFESYHLWTLRGVLITAAVGVAAVLAVYFQNWWEERSPKRKAKGIPEVITESDSLWSGIRK